VATAQGGIAIEQLRVGDQVLAESPSTGKVEREDVQAVIDDGVKPLIALDLSDGSTLKVTSNHGFWVDSGKRLDHAGWLEAGQLRPGDELRTAAGKHVRVTMLH
jgi:intein/homing endonuclease